MEYQKLTNLLGNIPTQLNLEKKITLKIMVEKVLK